MDVTAALQPERWIDLGLVAARCTGLFITAPFFGAGSVPAATRTSLAIVLSALLIGLVPPLHAQASILELALWGGVEILVGAVIGLVISFFMMATIVAGEVIGVQVGLASAEALNPGSGVNMPALGNLLYLTAVTLWFSAGGHLVMLEALAESFRVLPPGGPVGSAGLLEVALSASSVFVIGVRIALPIMMIMLLTTTAIGVLARSAPRVPVFLLSLPFTIVIGLYAFAGSGRGLNEFLGQWTQESIDVVARFLALSTP